MACPRVRFSRVREWISLANSGGTRNTQLGTPVAGLFKNILTFGAAGRVDSEQDRLDVKVREFHALRGVVDQRRGLMEHSIHRLISAKVAAVKSLRHLGKLSDNLSVRDRELAERDFSEGKDIELQSLDMAKATLSAGEAAINAARGLGTGASTALGAWALVATYGTASTGTAIATLSGAAATNATLAVLGGGTVAAGGGGIAAGAITLGGLFAIPALAGLAIFSHTSANKKIKIMRQHSLDIVEASEQCHKALLLIDLADARAAELSHATAYANEAFICEFVKVRRKLFPLGPLSRLFRLLRRSFGGRYFNNSEVSEIAYIGKIASTLARIVDTKVFASDGSVTQGAPA